MSISALEDKEIIFGYGSNLSRDLLRARLNDGPWHETEWIKLGNPIGPDPIDLGVARLAGYSFKYNLQDLEKPLEGFTTGNIVEDPNGHVFGAVYQITPDQLRLLDKDEDEGSSYKRTALAVQIVASSILEVGSTLSAYCYVGLPDQVVPDHRINPDPEYVENLIAFGQERGLSDLYINTHFKTLSHN